MSPAEIVYPPQRSAYLDIRVPIDPYHNDVVDKNFYRLIFFGRSGSNLDFHNPKDEYQWVDIFIVIKVVFFADNLMLRHGKAYFIVFR